MVVTDKRYAVNPEEEKAWTKKKQKVTTSVKISLNSVKDSSTVTVRTINTIHS